MAGYKILQAEKQGIYVLKFIGEIRLNLCSTLDNLVESITSDPAFKTVVIDLTETEVIDSTTLGLLAKITTVQANGNQTWHRVQVGPYEDTRELSRAQDLMVTQGIEPLMIKLQN